MMVMLPDGRFPFEPLLCINYKPTSVGGDRMVLIPSYRQRSKEKKSMKTLDPAKWLSVKEMMNADVPLLHLEDTIRTVIGFMQDYKLGTLPVVDKDNKLIAVFPRKRLFRALMDGASINTPIRDFVR